MSDLYVATYNEHVGCATVRRTFLGVFENEIKAMLHCAAVIASPSGDELWKWDMPQDGSYVYHVDTGTYYVVRPVTINKGEYL